MTTQDELIAALKAATFEEDGRVKLRCEDALRIGETLHVEPAVVGQTCNDLKIKMVQCKLGCFK